MLACISSATRKSRPLLQDQADAPAIEFQQKLLLAGVKTSFAHAVKWSCSSNRKKRKGEGGERRWDCCACGRRRKGSKRNERRKEKRPRKEKPSSFPSNFQERGGKENGEKKTFAVNGVSLSLSLSESHNQTTNVGTEKKHMNQQGGDEWAQYVYHTKLLNVWECVCVSERGTHNGGCCCCCCCRLRTCMEALLSSSLILPKLLQFDYYLSSPFLPRPPLPFLIVPKLGAVQNVRSEFGLVEREREEEEKESFSAASIARERERERRWEMLSPPLALTNRERERGREGERGRERKAWKLASEQHTTTTHNRRIFEEGDVPLKKGEDAARKKNYSRKKSFFRSPLLSSWDWLGWMHSIWRFLLLLLLRQLLLQHQKPSLKSQEGGRQQTPNLFSLSLFLPKICPKLSFLLIFEWRENLRRKWRRLSLSQSCVVVASVLPYGSCQMRRRRRRKTF